MEVENCLFIYDVHAHVFPDKIEQKASDSIGGFYDLHMDCDGTVAQLLDQAAQNGIGRICIHSVALNVHAMTLINTFIHSQLQAHPGMFTGMAAIHPDCGDFDRLIDEVRAQGFRGFKIHPDMQKFALDDKSAMDMFAAIEGRMPVIIHTGDYRYDYSHPEQMKRVLDAFPRLTCVCAHLGGWSEWDDAYRFLARYDNVYVDTSSSLYALTPERAAGIIRHYATERVMFGTDYPMWSAKEELARIAAVPLTDRERERIMGQNALELIG